MGVTAMLFIDFNDDQSQQSLINTKSHYRDVSNTDQVRVCERQPYRALGQQLNPELKPESGDGKKCAVSTKKLESLLGIFKTESNVLERQEYTDLAYLVRNNNNIAALVKSRILASELFEEKLALVNVLSHNRSDETIDFGVEMIRNMEGETKRLGLELIAAMKIREGVLRINNALLEASYEESDPELLSEVIVQLTQNQLDDSTQYKVAERFQHFLSTENTELKVRAIDGLARVADQSTVQATIKEYIQDANDDVKISAINAAFHLNASWLDEDIANTLARIAKDPQESESARNIASAVLDSHK